MSGGAEKPGPHRRRRYGWLAALLFFAVTVASASNLPPMEIRWGWFGVAVGMLLLSISLLAAEYRLAAWLLVRDVGWGDAMRISILSSAANLLPVPGGIAVRTDAIRRMGPGWRSALGSNVVMGLGWLGVALVMAGTLLQGRASPLVAWGFVGSGVLVVAAMATAVHRISKERRTSSAVALILLVESLYVGVSAGRLYALLSGLGIGITFPQATTLTIASALAAGVGFFPGGLGLRELLAGVVAPLAGLAPAVGAFAGVIDRIVGLIVRGALAMILWRTGARPDESDRPPPAAPRRP